MLRASADAHVTRFGSHVVGAETHHERFGSHILAAVPDLSRVEDLKVSDEHVRRRMEQLRTRDVLVDTGDVQINPSDIEINPPAVLIKPNHIEINPLMDDHIPPDIVLELSLVERSLASVRDIASDVHDIATDEHLQTSPDALLLREELHFGPWLSSYEGGCACCPRSSQPHRAESSTPAAMTCSWRTCCDSGRRLLARDGAPTIASPWRKRSSGEHRVPTHGGDAWSRKVLWPEFEQISSALRAYVDEITERRCPP